MRGARFLLFMLVLLFPFGALTASRAAAAPMAGPANEKLGTVAFANSCSPEAQESSSAVSRFSIPLRLRPAKEHSAKRSTATRLAPSPRGGWRRS
jgi:hypothetical protein